MVGHAVPGIVGFQNLHRHLSLLQLLTDEDRNQKLCFQRIARHLFLKEFLKAVSQCSKKIRSQTPHIHRNQRIHINSHAICLRSGCGLYNILGFHNFCQVVLLIHFADATGHTAVVGQRVFQHKASHTGLAAIYQILMDGTETFLAIVVIGIDHDERCAKNILSTPFIVINADDYYGKEGFRAVHEYLVNGGKSCMAGFVLKNTLSDNGGVTRGICKMDEQNNLTEVVETKNIVKTATGAEADGVAVDVNSLVSMNMWGLTPDFLTTLGDGFQEFFEKEVPGNPLKAEFLIPIFIGEQLEQGKMSVKVLKTNDTWYGMTYHEDVAAVKDSFKKMLENGVYKADLFCDL